MTEELENRITELEQEVAYLKGVAYGFGSFHLNDVETKNARRFFAEHKRHGQPGRDTFLPTSSITWSFTATGVGPFIKLTCRCGASENIEDQDSW